MGDDHGPHGPGSSPSRGRLAAGSSVLTPPAGMSVVPDDARGLLGAGLPRLAAAEETRLEAVASPCRCGHAPDVHRHWRRGSDCGECGVGACTAYRPRGGALRRLLGSVGLLH
jgi:hypothetical protein